MWEGIEEVRRSLSALLYNILHECLQIGNKRSQLELVVIWEDAARVVASANCSRPDRSPPILCTLKRLRRTGEVGEGRPSVACIDAAPSGKRGIPIVCARCLAIDL